MNKIIIVLVFNCFEIITEFDVCFYSLESPRACILHTARWRYCRRACLYLNAANSQKKYMKTPKQSSVVRLVMYKVLALMHDYIP